LQRCNSSKVGRKAADHQFDLELAQPG
jgi:hypothetical protein